MRGKKTRKIRKQVYGENSLKLPRDKGLGLELRRAYQKAKKA